MIATDLERQFKRLLDKEAIRELVTRYSVYIDFGRLSDMLDLFTEDCVVDYGPTFGGVHVGRAAWAAHVTRQSTNPHSRAPRFRSTSHHNANVLLEFVDDDTATGWVGLYAWHEKKDGTHAEVWGYYEDVYVRTPQGWRIKQRTERTAGEVNFPHEGNPLPRPSCDTPSASHLT